MGPAKRCPATDLFTALSSPAMKPQVLAQLSAETLTSKALSKDQFKQYLDTPPAGVYSKTNEPRHVVPNNVVF